MAAQVALEFYVLLIGRQALGRCSASTFVLLRTLFVVASDLRTVLQSLSSEVVRTLVGTCAIDRFRAHCALIVLARSPVLAMEPTCPNR